MKKSDETRQYIIEKSAPIFNKHGYVGTSMSQLIEAIGMTKGAIYGNFKNKDEIALAALNYNLSKVYEIFDKLEETIEDPIDRLIAFAKLHLDTYKTIDLFGGCPMLNGAIDSDFTHSLMKEHVAIAFKNWLKKIQSYIEEGQEKQQIKKDINAHYYSIIFGSIIEGNHLFARTMDSEKYIEFGTKFIIDTINNEFKI